MSHSCFVQHFDCLYFVAFTGCWCPRPDRKEQQEKARNKGVTSTYNASYLTNVISRTGAVSNVVNVPHVVNSPLFPL